MIDQDDEVTQLAVMPGEVYQQDVAQIDSQVATARKYPRNLRKLTDNAIAIVTIDKETAASCNYAVPRGGKSITGPTIHLAKILAQQYGNMRVEAKVVDVGEKHVTSQAVAWDLETNLAVKVEVKRSIVTKEGKRFSDDLVVVTGNAANSIAMRNAVFAVVPRAIVDKVYKTAIEMVRGDLSDEKKLIAKRKEVVDALIQTYNVKEEEILAAVGRVSLLHVTADDILVLIGIGQAIKDGDTTVDEAFRKAKSRPIPPSSEQKELERIKIMIKDAKDLKALGKLEKQCQGNDELMELYVERESELLPETK